MGAGTCLLLPPQGRVLGKWDGPELLALHRELLLPLIVHFLVPHKFIELPVQMPLSGIHPVKSPLHCRTCEFVNSS